MIYKPTQLVLSLLFIFPAILIAINAPDNYDTGLYHTQAIKWIEEYPAIPGLANLHGRFGFNPNVFSLFALTSLSSVFSQHIYSINFTVFVIVVPWFINTIYGIFFKQGLTGIVFFMVMLLLTVLLLTGNLTSPSPDFISLVFTIFVFAYTAGLTTAGRPFTFGNYLPVLILSAYVVTVKLSVLPLLLLPLLLLYRVKISARQWCILLFIPVVIMLPWLTRNVILSGWLIYPFPSLDLFGFDWKVPLDKAAGEHESVTGWARNPGPAYAASAHMAITDWFPLWWMQLKVYEQAFITTGLVLPLISLVFQVINRLKANYIVTCIVITALSGSLFWVLTAPVLRFGLAFIVAGISVLLLAVKWRIPATFKPVLILNILIALLFCAETGRARSYIKNSVYHLNSVVVKPAILPNPVGSYFLEHKINGIRLYEPLPGDQCFDHGLPCTPYPDPNIVLRGNTVSAGFKIKPQPE
ncbi:hypothetical protein DJ568_14415 [Mucilaginibacter hurinus]|uniref:DUF8201 domain-containing protein n=2 Tax=Mucilaginibacter hurinus TaxID=2201324 RepID=A0A367GN05_9SPHI|nr:hypothetical protein DJ568_14415 [Mucilaginibacter hurinus]